MGLTACPCAGRKLGKLIQPAILAVLAQGPMHGYGLAERIGRLPICGGEGPDSTGIYRFLKAMEDRGLVASTWDLSERGPARKTYGITPAGEECLAQWVKTLQHYRRGINALVRLARRSLDKSAS